MFIVFITSVSKIIIYKNILVINIILVSEKAWGQDWVFLRVKWWFSIQVHVLLCLWQSHLKCILFHSENKSYRTAGGGDGVINIKINEL